jgi:hypothetical protein
MPARGSPRDFTPAATVPMMSVKMRALEAQITALYGRRWPWLALWYLEGCLAVAAIWAVTHHAAPLATVPPFMFLLACGVALAIPFHAVRMGMMAAGLGARARRLALQLFLALSAAATAATLSVQQGWAAIIFILLVGNALWALELELRAGQAPSREPGTGGVGPR